MLTGARRSEVLTARWDMFDLDAGVWMKPSAHTKQTQGAPGAALGAGGAAVEIL